MTFRVETIGEPTSGVSLGSWTPPTLVFAEDATIGLYLKEIHTGNLVALFNAVSLLRVRLWTEGDSSTTDLDGSDATYTSSENEQTGVWTVTATFADYSGVSFSFTFTPIGNGFRVAIVPTNTSGTYGIEWFDLPGLGFKPDSGDLDNGYMVHGVVGGFTVKNPEDKEINSAIPAGCQVWDYFDSETKLHVYVQTDDEAGYNKGWLLEGDGATAASYWRHHTKNPRKSLNGAADLTVPYNLDIRVFRGLTADGRCGHYDTALMYRDWGASSDRPWIGDPWVDSASVSDRVKNSTFLYVAEVEAATAATIMVEDARRVKDFTGSDEMLLLLYGWHANYADLVGVNFKPPFFTPIPFQADVDSALGDAEAESIWTSLYTVPHPWDITLDAGTFFDYTNFLGVSDYNSLATYMLKNHLNVVQQSANTAFFDLAQNVATVKAIIRDTILYDGSGGAGSENIGFYTQTTNPPHGFYFDLWGGGSNLPNYATAISPNGNLGTWESGKITITEHIRDQVRLLDADAYFTTENPEEDLIPSLDLMHTNGDFSITLWGVPNQLFGIVYSRYVALGDLNITLNTDALDNMPLGTGWESFSSYLMASFHQTGGHLCLNIMGQGVLVPTDPPTLLNCPQYPLLLIIKRVEERFAANTAMKDYMREGLRQRPLPSSWEGDQIEQEMGHLDWHNSVGTQLDSPELAFIGSSVWLNPSTNAVGIVFTSAVTSDTESTIYMRAEAYGWSKESVKILYRNVDGVRTELTRWTDVLDYDIDLEFDGGGPAVDLYEVVLA